MYNKTMAEPFDIERKISEIEAKLANLDHHRNQLLDELTQLRQLNIQKDSPAQLMLTFRELKLITNPLKRKRSGYSVLYSKGGRTYSHAGSKIPKPESQATPPSVAMNGKQVSAKSLRLPARNAIFARLFKLAMRSSGIISWELTPMTVLAETLQ